MASVAGGAASGAASGIDDKDRTRPVAWVVASLALCTLLPSLGTSIANVALPTLAGAFDASFQQVQWVVLAYLLAVTTLVVGAGRLGDLAGRRRLLMVGIVLFTVASGLCGVAGELWLLVAARALQGVGAAAMIALAMAFVADAVPKGRTGAAMGLLGTMSAVGTALGPSLGGLLIAKLGWPAIFVVNVPLGMVALVLVHRCLPPDRRASQPVARFDVAGTVLLAVTLAAYALAMTLGRASFGLVNVTLLLLAAIGLTLFVRVEGRAPAPLIRLSRLRDRRLMASLAMSALVATVMMATLVVGPFYLTAALAIDTAVLGVVLSAGPLVAAAMSVPGGRLVDRVGASRTSIAALAAMLAGCVALVGAPVALGIPGYVVPIVILTAGYAVFQAANNSGVMAEVASHERGVVAGMLNLSRNLGLVTGASAMGAVYAVAARAGEHGAGRGAVAAMGMRATFAIAAVLLVVALVVAVRSRSVVNARG